MISLQRRTGMWERPHTLWDSSYWDLNRLLNGNRSLQAYFQFKGDKAEKHGVQGKACRVEIIT